MVSFSLGIASFDSGLLGTELESGSSLVPLSLVSTLGIGILFISFCGMQLSFGILSTSLLFVGPSSLTQDFSYIYFLWSTLNAVHPNLFSVVLYI